MTIVDAHLDLAYNAARGRDVTKPAAHQPADEEGIPTVGLPDLRSGSVGLICATIFCMPSLDGKPGYRTATEAYVAGSAQLKWYQEQQAAGTMRLVRTAGDLATAPGAAQPAVLLLEGADPLRAPSDLYEFHLRGVRIVGMAWKQTRYAGGTGTPGPLTAEGLALVREMDRLKMIHDASHLAEASFWQLLERSTGPVIASHSNCRAIVPTDRQLSDDMIRAIVVRDGVIGINFYDKFLLRPDQYGKRRATLEDVVAHVRHICEIAGDTAHVGLGTDMDGGLGREQIPQEISTSADLRQLGDVLRRAGFGQSDVEGIMGGNWIRFFTRALDTAGS